MKFTETELPGIGKKFCATLRSGEELSLVLHKSGRREIYVSGEDDEDPRHVLTLSDEEARLVGAVLTGAYYQPVTTQAISYALADLEVDWIRIPDHSFAIGRSIGDLEVRKKTGASIVALQSDGGTVVSPGPTALLHAGTTVTAVGSRQHVDALRKLLERTH